MSKAVSYSRNHDGNSKSIDRFEIKNYFKELEKGYVSNEGPGPAAYRNDNRNPLSTFRTSLNGSFTKEKRKVEKLNKSNFIPGPHTYNTGEAHNTLSSIRGGGTMGKAKKKIDI